MRAFSTMRGEMGMDNCGSTEAGRLGRGVRQSSVAGKGRGIMGAGPGVQWAGPVGGSAQPGNVPSGADRLERYNALAATSAIGPSTAGTGGTLGHRGTYF